MRAMSMNKPWHGIAVNQAIKAHVLSPSTTRCALTTNPDADKAAASYKTSVCTQVFMASNSLPCKGGEFEKIISPNFHSGSQRGQVKQFHHRLWMHTNTAMRTRLTHRF